MRSRARTRRPRDSDHSAMANMPRRRAKHSRSHSRNAARITSVSLCERKRWPQLFQLAPQLGVIVDLAVEDDHGIAVFGNDGLVAGFQVDDLQARGRQRYAVGFKDTLLVRSAVQNGSRRIPDPPGVWAIITMRKASDSTQDSLPLDSRNVAIRHVRDISLYQRRLSGPVKYGLSEIHCCPRVAPLRGNKSYRPRCTFGQGRSVYNSTVRVLSRRRKTPCR